MVRYLVIMVAAVRSRGRLVSAMVAVLGIVLVFHNGSFTQETGALRRSYTSVSEFAQSQSRQAESAQLPQNVSRRVRRLLRARWSITLA